MFYKESIVRVLSITNKRQEKAVKENNFGVCILFKGCLDAKIKPWYVTGETFQRQHAKKQTKNILSLEEILKEETVKCIPNKRSGAILEYMKYFDEPIEITNPDRQMGNGYEHEIHSKE